MMMRRPGPVVYYCFDSSGFTVAGGHPRRMQALISALIVACLAAIPAVGTIISIALLAALCTSPGQLIWGSAALGTFVCLFGLGIAVAADLSVGGTIGVVAGVMFAVVRGGVGRRGTSGY